MSIESETADPDIALDGPPDHIKVMRHLRKLARSRAYVAPVEVVRLRVDPATGEVRYRRRKVNRKRVQLRGRSSGFLVVNDGEATARDIARLLGAPPPLRGDYRLVA